MHTCCHLHADQPSPAENLLKTTHTLTAAQPEHSKLAGTTQNSEIKRIQIQLAALPAEILVLQEQYWKNDGFNKFISTSFYQKDITIHRMHQRWLSIYKN